MVTPMPTAAKAVAAASFAVAGWMTAHAYVPNMPVPTSVGFFRELTAALGAIVGWRVMGTSVGKGYVAAVGSGWKTMIIMVFFALLLFGIYEMLQLSVRMRYDRPMEAVVDVFNRMLERSVPLLSAGVLGVMAVGGGIAGMVTENASRRWR